MKITKTQLKRIIKEELEAVMAGGEIGDQIFSDDELEGPPEDIVVDTGLEGEEMITEDAGLASIPTGTLLGIAATSFIVTSAGIAAGNLVAQVAGLMLGAAKAKYVEKTKQWKRDAFQAQLAKGEDILKKIEDHLSANKELLALAEENHGRWSEETRERKRELAKEFAVAVEKAIGEAIVATGHEDTTMPSGMARSIQRRAMAHGKRLGKPAK